jgi:tetratricopeptide (TPR) repeat protein
LEKSITTDTISKKGLRAYIDGQNYDSRSMHQESVECFTLAIKYGVNITNVFLRRGCSLQILQQHKRAIHDFNRVITQSPDDCYPLFLRSVSKFRIGDIKNAIKDIQKAIILSLVDNETNDEYREKAWRLGFGTHTVFYKIYLHNFRRKVD